VRRTDVQQIGPSTMSKRTGRGGRARRPRVLYLAFYFPPTRASGVYRALATANHLADSGWDVTVCTAPREFFTEYIRSYDDSLEERIDPRVRVERPRMSFNRWEKDLRRYGAFRGNLPVLSAMGRNLVQGRLFPEHYATWIPGVVARALRMHRKEPFDLVLATGNPFASFAAAWMIGRSLRIPYALDYRDPWTFNPLTEALNFPPGSSAWSWERRVLRDAAEVVHVNEPIRRWYAERYPFAAERMTVVPNGWEPELLGGPAPVEPVPAFPERAGARRRPLRFGYLGTMTDQLPLEQLFAGWREARRHPELADAELHLHGHLGFFPHSADPLLARMPLDEGIGVRYRGPVAKAQVGEVYRELDAMVFLAGGSTYVTSGKIFEYMATGRPIVSVHRPGIAAADVLRGHPMWFGGEGLASAEVAASLIAAARTARTLRPEEVAAARAHAERFTREATLTPLEQRLRRLAGAPPVRAEAPDAPDAHDRASVQVQEAAHV
jgi:glycosyltransferase involved in cell wall biosynthesis